MTEQSKIPGELPTLAEVCGARCDHGSECLLLASHVPNDRHETQHGCVFFDAPEPPYVCPGCYAVGTEPHLSWCIDDQMEREHRHAIESGDYDRMESDDE